jgi:hypothetical protein
MRRHPKAMARILEIAAQQAYETSYFNIMGQPLNPQIKFSHHPNTLKKVREFFLKNVAIRKFFNGLEKKDERLILMDIRAQNMKAGDRLVRRDTRDRALYFVISGSLFGIGDGFPVENKLYPVGEILGS